MKSHFEGANFEHLQGDKHEVGPFLHAGAFTVNFHKVYETLPNVPKMKGKKATFDGTIHETPYGGFQIEHSPEGKYHGTLDLGSHLIESIEDIQGNTLWRNPNIGH